MEWTPDNDNNDVEDRRGQDYGGGGGGGFGIPLGGGGLGIAGFVVLLVISVATGHNFLGGFLAGGGGNGGGAPMQQSRPQPMPGGPVQETASEHRDVQLITFVLNDVQRTWTTVLPQQTNHPYRHAKLVLFRNATASGCGDAQSATGPFYCPQDEKVYIDLGFWDELNKLGGDSKDFAQSYVLAHELGHHVQKILGTEQRVQQGMQDPSRRSALSVALELQADCYAGVWSHNAQDRLKINEEDVADALKSAAAVGDDHIQKMSGRAVSPESWTHGSSAQRVAWFKRGLQTGEVSACNTFGNSSASNAE